MIWIFRKNLIVLMNFSIYGFAHKKKLTRWSQLLMHTILSYFEGSRESICGLRAKISNLGFNYSLNEKFVKVSYQQGQHQLDADGFFIKNNLIFFLPSLAGRISIFFHYPLKLCLLQTNPRSGS